MALTTCRICGFEYDGIEWDTHFFISHVRGIKDVDWNCPCGEEFNDFNGLVKHLQFLTTRQQELHDAMAKMLGFNDFQYDDGNTRGPG